VPRDPDEIDALLAGNRLGGPARERVLRRVLGSVAPPPRRSLRAALVAALAACSVAVAVVVVARRHGPGPGDYLGSKGAAPPVAPSVDPVCGDGTGPCRVGQRLFFRVGASPVRRWAAIFAESSDARTAGGRIWMFPGPDGASPEIPASDAPAILRRAVELGPDLTPGRYRLTILLFDHPPAPGAAVDVAAAAARITRWLVIQ